MFLLMFQSPDMRLNVILRVEHTTKTKITTNRFELIYMLFGYFISGTMPSVAPVSPFPLEFCRFCFVLSGFAIRSALNSIKAVEM